MNPNEGNKHVLQGPLESQRSTGGSSSSVGITIDSIAKMVEQFVREGQAAREQRKASRGWE